MFSHVSILNRKVCFGKYGIFPIIFGHIERIISPFDQIINGITGSTLGDAHTHRYFNLYAAVYVLKNLFPQHMTHFFGYPSGFFHFG